MEKYKIPKNSFSGMDGVPEILFGFQQLWLRDYTLLLTVIFHHPSIWNTGTTVTEENKEWVYQKLAHMLVILRLIIQLVFFCILYQTVRAKNLGLWGSLLLYTSPFLPLLWYFYLLHKKRKGSVGI